MSVVCDESRGFNEMSSDCSHASCPPPPPPPGSGGACAANGDTPKKKFVKMLQSMIWKWLPLSSWFYAMEYGSMYRQWVGGCRLLFYPNSPRMSSRNRGH